MENQNHKLNNKDFHQQRRWEKGWEGHDLAQLLRFSQTSFFEKLKWLDEAQTWIDSMKKNCPGNSH